MEINHGADSDGLRDIWVGVLDSIYHSLIVNGLGNIKIEIYNKRAILHFFSCNPPTTHDGQMAKPRTGDRAGALSWCRMEINHRAEPGVPRRKSLYPLSHCGSGLVQPEMNADGSDSFIKWLCRSKYADMKARLSLVVFPQ